MEDILSSSPNLEVRMQSRLVLLLLTAPLIMLGSSSCSAINYSFAPADTITLASPISNNSAITFSISSQSGYLLEVKELQFSEAIQRGLLGPSAFKNAQPVEGMPEKGLYVSVDIARRSEAGRPRSGGAFIRQLNRLLSSTTLFAIPYYGESFGNINQLSTSKFVFTYVLYLDGARINAYPYFVEARVFRWLLAPLVFPLLSSDWDTPFSDDRRGQELLTSTTRQFLRDAQRDGFL